MHVRPAPGGTSAATSTAERTSAVRDGARATTAARGPLRSARHRAGRPPSRRRARRLALAAGGCYLVLSVVVWWHLWADPAGSTTCGCGDNALTLWVVEWPAYAISHGLNPFFSSALFHPRGINMVPNSLALGTVTAPITWAFGPVAASNVILTLSPPLSAIAMYWLLRRWTSSFPGAFVGGLLYGFSPFALTSLALGHPNFGLGVFPPLIVGCLDELVVRRRRSPRAVGMFLGLLLVAEFFVSVEVLLILMGFGVLALAVLSAGTLWRPGADRGAATPVAAGLGWALLVSVVLLAYPLWFYFAGPAHLKGRAWPNSAPGIVGSSLGDFFNGSLSPALTGTMHLFGGYQGPALPSLTLLGGGVVAVSVVGAMIWWRDRRLLLFVLLGLVAAVLSVGVRSSSWTPWRLFTHVAVIDNIVPVNIAAVTNLCAAVAVGLAVGHAQRWASERVRHGAPWGPAVPSALAALLAAVAVVPIAAVSWANVPMTVRRVSSPRWFEAVATRPTPVRRVVLPYPAALGGIQSSMAWQAVGGIPFEMVGGGGPGIVPSRAGPERPGFEVLAAASLPLGPPPAPSGPNVSAVRAALRGWGVTTVVVPDQPELPTYDRGRPVPYAVGFLAAATGVAPRHEARSWVFAVGRLGVPRPMSPAAFEQCLTGVPSGQPASAASCVLRSPPS